MTKTFLKVFGLLVSGIASAQTTNELKDLKAVVAIQQAQIIKLTNQMQALQTQFNDKFQDQQTQFDKKLDTLNQTACKRTYNPSDLGYGDDFRGWYNVDGCIVYCRWVGNSGTGGDPQRLTTYGSSFWACADGGEYRQFSSFNYHMIAKYIR
ncbi:MAG: hypothetical protein NTX25_03135 [Proteobacteria bacterium]|nr:hypothetical protein [Pseudomonadota bacterium]